MTGETHIPLNDDVREAAAAWHMRMQSDGATGEDWTALTIWLEESPQHRAAFDEIDLLADEIAINASEILAGVTRPSAEIVPFPARKPPPQRKAERPPAAAIAAAAAAVFVAVGFGGWQASGGPVQTFQTGRGETRAITLADGSRINLDAASRMTVRLGWFSRQVTMSEGEATFDVARNPKKPFEIAVGDQRVRVIGTEFNIRHYDGSTDVTVRRGIVAIYQSSLGDTPVARLTKGMALNHVDGSPASMVRAVNPDRAFAWTEGRIICDSQPLAELIPYLNRRYGVSIRLAPYLASRRFSGVLELGDEKDVVRRLADYLSIRLSGSEREYSLS